MNIHLKSQRVPLDERARGVIHARVEQVREREQGSSEWLRIAPAELYGPLPPISGEFGS